MNTDTSHVTRFSDSSLFDEICVNCGLTDNAGLPGKGNDLEKPCTNPVGKGGKTYEEWQKQDRERIARLTASMAGQ